MSSPPDSVRAAAEATKAVAEAAGKALDMVSATGAYSKRLLGDALAEGGGILRDQVAYWRKMRLLNLEEKFNAACAARGIDPDTMRPLSLAQTVLALEAATFEESDEVQTLWAELLANAVDPESGVTLKKLYVSLLRDMGPAEAALLEMIGELRGFKNKEFRVEETTVVLERIKGVVERKWRTFADADRLGALVNLRRLGCIAPHIPPPPIERLLKQGTRSPGDSARSPMAGVDPTMFGLFINWLLDAMEAIGSARPPNIQDGFRVVDGAGGTLIDISVGELRLELTPLGDELLRACTHPNRS